jgi:hypothetical protein
MKNGNNFELIHSEYRLPLNFVQWSTISGESPTGIQNAKCKMQNAK